MLELKKKNVNPVTKKHSS